MTYYIEPVDSGDLPEGKDWLFMETPDGDATFLVSRAAGRFELPLCALEQIVPRVGKAAGAPLSLAG